MVKSLGEFWLGHILMSFDLWNKNPKRKKWVVNVYKAIFVKFIIYHQSYLNYHQFLISRKRASAVSVSSLESTRSGIRLSYRSEWIRYRKLLDPLFAMMLEITAPLLAHSFFVENNNLLLVIHFAIVSMECMHDYWSRTTIFSSGLNWPDSKVTNLPAGAMTFSRGLSRSLAKYWCHSSRSLNAPQVGTTRYLSFCILNDFFPRYR